MQRSNNRELNQLREVSIETAISTIFPSLLAKLICQWPSASATSRGEEGLLMCAFRKSRQQSFPKKPYMWHQAFFRTYKKPLFVRFYLILISIKKCTHTNISAFNLV